jgi:hypothetical protein
VADPLKNQISTVPASVPVHRWQTAEAASSAASSASSKDCLENIGIRAVVEPELKLREVERQIVLADVVIGPDNPAFQETPKSLDIVRVNLPAHVLAFRVRDGIVRIPQRIEVVIALVLIRGDEIDVTADGLADKTIEGLSIGILDHLADDIALARDRADHRGLAAHSGNMLLLVPMAILVFAAHSGLVNFDFAHQLGEILVLHRGADALEHVPSRPVIAASDLAMDLECADSLFALTHQVDHFKPSAERVVSVLEYRLGDDAEPIAVAPATILILTGPVERARLERVNTFLALATRTLDAIRPAHIAEQFFTGFLCRELPFQFGEGDVRLSGERLSGFRIHEKQNSGSTHECQA